tara:strand:+ start:3505 stop:3957 length:453 start_codon:yes stop_codon:yes gene_type:complete
MMRKFLYEDMADAIKKLKALGRAVSPDTITRKDLVDLTRAKANWNMEPEEMEVVNQNTKLATDTPTRPDRGGNKMPDLAGDTDFTDTAATPVNDTEVDGGSTTAMVSALQDKKDELADSIALALEPELANAEPDLKQKIAKAIEATLLGH